LDDGSVTHARRKVISLAKALLPSEEWAGWERLGWEEQGQEGTSRRHSFDLGDGQAVPEAEEEEEPEYLFPNRTPASAQAFASRRKAVRSKSLGAANFKEWMAEMPKLQRTRTEPYKGQPFTSDTALDVGLDDEDDNDELDAAELLAHPDSFAELQLGRVTSGTALGPSLAEALKAADDGKRLIEYEDLPFSWRNNEHILTG
jgi:adiponectin receptor